jgi:hypothetical protein
MADLVTLEQAKAHLGIPDATTSHDTEIDLFIDAVTAHVDERFGSLPTGTYTEFLSVVDDGDGTNRYWLRPAHHPISSVTSATDENGTAYTTSFVISADGRSIRHTNISSGEWTLVYTAGMAAPADLKLAALEDIRGLFQPGQIGPVAAFGAFGAENTDIGPTYRPVRLWPRVDAWIESRRGPMVA